MMTPAADRLLTVDQAAERAAATASNRRDADSTPRGRASRGRRGMTGRQDAAGPGQPLATPEDLAEFLNDIPVKTLAQWRSRGIGPKYRKVGRRVRYDWADIHAWLARQCPDRTWV